MRILYLSQYFPPEVGATQGRAWEMARGLAAAGHEVTVICEIPNHPQGVVPPAYRGRLWSRSTEDGIEVVRVWTATSPRKTFSRRMAFYTSFMVHAALAGLLVRGRFDVVFATSPPLFVGGAALALSHLRRLPMVFEVRDLWPESAVELGELTNPAAIRWATRLEEACYRRALRIVVVTRGIRERLEARGIPPEKLSLIPNGANVELFRFRPGGREELRGRLGVDGCFVAIYAGIHGVAQGLETVLEAAEHLRARPDIRVLFVGDGPEKVALQAGAVARSLSNLTFLPAQPREAIPDILSAADAALVVLRDAELFRGALPSKLFDAWACERPVVLAVDGEARELLDEAEGGVFVPPEDPGRLASAIERLAGDPAGCAAMGRRGRELTVARFSRAAQARSLEEVLRECR
ncbi:MAG: glycosyltransferase family 4 protein [Acidobacteria bacterium]|nr:glycosyltransferase family 4 protein [Acidobacteriota bacterium]